MESEDVVVVERIEVEVLEFDFDFKGNLKGGKERIKVKIIRKKKRCLLLEDFDRIFEDKMFEVDVKYQEEVKDVKKGKKKRLLDKGEFKEVFQVEILSNEVIQLDIEMKIKGVKKVDFLVYERREVKLNKKFFRIRKLKFSFEDMLDIIGEEMVIR